MRSGPVLFFLCCALPAATLAAQPPQATSIHCTVQALSPITDADRAFIAGDFAKAESLYSAQLSGPAAPANYAGTVRSQLAQNKLHEALATAQREANAAPNSADAQALLGDVLLRSGQISDATAAFTKAVQINPCTARAQFGLGRLSDLSSNHATAARKFAAAHALSPGDPEITAAYLATLSAPQHAAGLHALLASNPVLPPDTVANLTDQALILDQHKICTVAQEFPTASLELAPLMFNGKYERSWGLKVRINGSTTPLLELDSSVSGIVLNPADAQKAGVHPLNSAIPPNPPYTGVADNVRIGNLEYHDCPVHVVPANLLADSNSLIGTNFFRDHLIHIDYVAQRLTLNPLPAPPSLSTQAPATLTDQYIAPEEKDWSPVFVSAQNLLVPTMINKKGPFLFLLDTGTGRSIISPTVAEAVLSTGADATLNLIGTSGSIIKVVPREGGHNNDVTNIITNVTSVRSPDGALIRVTTPSREPVLRFAGNEFGDLYSISFDISRKSRDMNVEAAGVLGFRTLHEFFIDLNYRDGLVKLKFDQNVRYDAREREKGTQDLEY